jgi:DNA-binding NarL/FixJ family response regulator
MNMADTDLIRTLVVDDHPDVRELVAVVLQDDPTISVVAEAANGREALEKIAAVRPDVVIMDITMPELDGVETTRQVVHGPAPCAVVMLTTSEESQNVFRSLAAGASAYVLKRRMARDLIAAVRSVSDGLQYLSPPLRTLDVHPA